MFDFRTNYKNIIVLTGAGISAESGIPTFRDAKDGLWEDHKIEDVATPLAYQKNPNLVNRFYNERRNHLFKPEISPNAAHKALAEFEKRHKGGFAIITQNVDDLHERAGSKRVLHMHGELQKKRCTACEEVSLCLSNLNSETVCKACGESGTLRPHIVWFGEMPFDLEKCFKLLEICHLFVSIGTSGHVYPAAEFVTAACKGVEHWASDPLAKENSKQILAKAVEINLEPSINQNSFDEGFYGKATEEVPTFFESLNYKQ